MGFSYLLGSTVCPPKGLKMGHRLSSIAWKAWHVEEGRTSGANERMSARDLRSKTFLRLAQKSQMLANDFEDMSRKEIQPCSPSLTQR